MFKRILHLGLIFIMTFGFSATALGQNDAGAKNPVTLFESAENMQKMKSYKMNQTFLGGVTVTPDDKAEFEKIDVQMRLGVSSQVVNLEPYKSNTKNLLSGDITLKAEGENKPFESLVLSFRADLITIVNDGIYARLQTLSLDARGIGPEDEEDYREFREEFDAEIKKIKNQWVYIPEDYFTGELEEGMPDEFRSMVDQEALLKDFKDKGVEQTYKTLLEDLIKTLYKNGEISADEQTVYNELLEEFFKTEFFSAKPILHGIHKGGTYFSLDKKNIMRFVEMMAEKLGEEISQRDKLELRTLLTKFSVSGLYKTDEKNRIFDVFRLKLAVRNIEELTGLKLEYGYKISKINEIERISEPDEFTHIDNFGLSFLPDSNEEGSGDDEMWNGADTDLEDLDKEMGE